MFPSANSVERLINWLSRLPGIGRKSATRLAFFILKLPADEALQLADLIHEVKERVKFCSTCFNISETEQCVICTDSRRQRNMICIVEEAMDVAALDRSDIYSGLFHVLGGRLSPLDGIGPDDLRIKELLPRINEEVQEIIIATNPNVEGEATAQYLSKLISPLGPKITRIARGLPVGSDLEYADSVTLSRALDGRQEM